MYNFIDVEASGFGVGSYPIEVGVALADGTTFCTLIKPLEEWTHWHRSAEKLHGISRETLLLKGKSVLNVALLLNEWLDGQVVYTDAWGNDTCWISLLFEEAGVRQRFMLESIVVLLDAEKKQHWHKHKAMITDSMSLPRHRASSDALILQKTLESMC